MSKIRIRNFGPIKEGHLADDDWLDIKKITVFIGNQGSGKSTIAKVLSTLTWLEKALNRGDLNAGNISHDFFERFFDYQRIRSYFKEDTEIDYEGDKFTFSYSLNFKFPKIKEKPDAAYHVPKIMYVPAERNFLSVIENAYELRHLPYNLSDFGKELRNFLKTLNQKEIALPFENLHFRYDSVRDISFVKGADYEVNLTESSSGYQSLIPLYLVSSFLSAEIQKGEHVLRNQLSAEQSIRRNREISDISFDTSLSPSQKEKKIKEVDAKYINTCFINIVEEPEQNLFPSSQQKVLYSLLEMNNLREANKLVLTTHSPYLINYLTLAVKANFLKAQLLEDNQLSKLNKIVPLASSVKPEDLAVYELDEVTGRIKKLPTYHGLPTDNNALNNLLGQGNQLFDELLEIEEEI